MVDDVKSIAFALDPTNIPSFLLDWEITKRCNMDCSYCPTGALGGHDNTTEHPPLSECLATIDFIYQYVDLYMQHIKPSHRKVVLNVYGGEALFHPDIVEILQQCRKKYTVFQDKWKLTITCTTNGAIPAKHWKRIIPLIDEFTMSYHTEATPKQKKMYLDNTLYLKEIGHRFKCVVLMHNDAKMFSDAESVIEFCQRNDIRYSSKPLDNVEDQWKYTTEQFTKMKTFWIKPVTRQDEYKKKLDEIGITEQVSSIGEGRACCGSRKLSLNSDLKSSVTFVPRQGFKEWYCSVNWFFLFVRQLTGEVFTNKDCEMSTTGTVEPLGSLTKSQQILDTLRLQLETKTLPIIQCKKSICQCGYCAPKAESLDEFLKLIKRTVPEPVFYLQK